MEYPSQQDDKQHSQQHYEEVKEAKQEDNFTIWFNELPTFIENDDKNVVFE